MPSLTAGCGVAASHRLRLVKIEWRFESLIAGRAARHACRLNMLCASA